MEHHLPEIWVKKLYKHLKEIITALGKYLKAQALLILISFIISVIGLYIFKIAGLNVKYPLLLYNTVYITTIKTSTNLTIITIIVRFALCPKVKS